MKNVKVTMMAMAFVGLTTMSCDSKKETVTEVQTEEVATNNSEKQNSESERVLADYMTLKNALVDTDEKAAANEGRKLEETLKGLNVENYSSEQQEDLKEILSSASSNSNQITQGTMETQREYFQKLTKDITDMVAITGTEHTLYQQYCPMYANDTGGAWLSMEKEIRNPYFGSKMMKCGEVQKEIK